MTRFASDNSQRLHAPPRGARRQDPSRGSGLRSGASGAFRADEAVPARQVGLLWGFVAAVLTAALPFAGRLAPLAPACPFKSLTGWPCLSCGTTRAALALSRLDLLAAMAWNPLAAAGIVILLGGGLLAGAASLSGRPLRLGRRPAWLRGGAIAALAANWIWLIASGR